MQRDENVGAEKARDPSSIRGQSDIGSKERVGQRDDIRGSSGFGGRGDLSSASGGGELGQGQLGSEQVLGSSRGGDSGSGSGISESQYASQGRGGQGQGQGQEWAGGYEQGGSQFRAQNSDQGEFSTGGGGRGDIVGGRDDLVGQGKDLVGKDWSSAGEEQQGPGGSQQWSGGSQQQKGYGKGESRVDQKRQGQDMFQGGHSNVL